MSTKIEPLLTVDDLVAIPEDLNVYELIDGKIFVSDSHWSVTHQHVLGNLIVTIGAYIRQNSVGQFWPSVGVILSRYDSVIPDLSFISKNRLAEIASGEHVTGAPDLVIEILLPRDENVNYDRVVKRDLYGKYGVKEYWVVDPAKRNIEVYLLEGRSLKLHTVYKEHDELISSVLPGFSCKVETIFAF